MQGSPLEQFAVYRLSFFGYTTTLPITNFFILASVVAVAALLIFVFSS